MEARSHNPDFRVIVWVIALGLAAGGVLSAFLASGAHILGGSSRAPAPPPPLAKGTEGPPPDAPSGWRLVWNDEFDERSCPDPAKWGFEHGFIRNGEDQWYRRANAACRRGVLDIEARRASLPNPDFRPGSADWHSSRPTIDYTSASLMSKRHFTYGRFEMRARIDTRPGSWPAFWTLSPDGGWPRTGEVDIMEYYRDAVLANVCRPRRSRCGWSSARQSLATLGGLAWARQFHVWRMDWSAGQIALFLDGELVNRFPLRGIIHGWPNPYIGKPQRLLLSQAIGGINGGDPAVTRFPVRLQVDWVRAYEPRRGR